MHEHSLSCVAIATWSRSSWLVLLGTLTCAMAVCPEQDNGMLTITSFSGQKMENVSRVLVGQDTELRCCASNFDRIDWFKFIQSRQEWQPYPWCERCDDWISFLDGDRNQTLILNAPIYGTDDGSYICRIYNDTMGDALEQKINLILIDCGELLKEGPLLTQMSEDHKYVEAGQNVSLLCEGFFGCAKENTIEVQQAYWRMFADGKPGMEEPIPEGHKYQIVNYTSADGITVGANLTIYDASREDFQVRFKCSLHTGDDRTSKHWTLQLSMRPTNREHIVDLRKVTVASLLTVLGLAFITVLPIYLWGPRIDYIIRRSTGLIKPNKYQYDVTVIYGEEGDDPTVTFARKTLKPKLDEDGYCSFTMDDISGGERVLTRTCEALEQSFGICFVVSPPSYLDDNQVYLLNVAHALKHTCNIFLIQLEKDGKIVTESEKANNMNLSEKYKGMTIIKWPVSGHEKSKRLLNNIWYKVKIRLPAVKRPKSSRDDSLSPVVKSDLLLSSSQEEYARPAGIVIT